MNTVEVRFKKSFVGTSSNGLTFHWLRCIYAEAINEAVDHAIRLVYSPSVLAASVQTQHEVSNEVTYCRERFEEMMGLTSKGFLADHPLPKRININFASSYSGGSNLARIYEWLLLKSGQNPTEPILHATRLVYLPAALAASPQPVSDPNIQVERARLLFEQRMTLAIWESNPTDSASMTKPLHQKGLALPSNNSINPSLVCQERGATLDHNASTDAEEIHPTSTEEDFDDDFVDVDRTLDFD
ncbi:MAG TPA: hypothetical protein V6D19_22400 [Stenomitos sp.]